MQRIRGPILSALRYLGTTDTMFLFSTTLAFYAIVFAFNLNNKTLLVSVFLLAAIHARRFGDIGLGIFFAYVTSLVFHVGKLFEFEQVSIHLLSYFSYNRQPITAFSILTPADILGCALLVWTVRDVAVRGWHRISMPVKMLVAYVLWNVGVSVFVATNPTVSLAFSLKSLPWAASTVYMDRLRRELPSTRILIVSLLMAAIVFEGGVASLQGVRNGYLGSSLEETTYTTADSVDDNRDRFRPLGTFLHANNMSQYVMTALPMAVAGIYIGTPDIPLLAGWAAAAGAVALLLGQGRSSVTIAAAAVVSTLYVIERLWRRTIAMKPDAKRRTILAIVLIAAPLLYIFASRAALSIYSFEDEASGSSRTELVREWSGIVWRNPLFGVGAGMTVEDAFFHDPTGITSRFAQPVHNAYILTAAENGLIGSALLWLFFVAVLRTTLYNAFRKTDDDAIAIGALTGVMAGLVNYIVQLPHEMAIAVIVAMIGYWHAENQYGDKTA